MLLLVLCSALASSRYALADLIEFDIEEYDDDYTSGVIVQNSDNGLKTIDDSEWNAGQYSRDNPAEPSIPKISEKQYIQTSSPNVETSKTWSWSEGISGATLSNNQLFVLVVVMIILFVAHAVKKQHEAKVNEKKFKCDLDYIFSINSTGEKHEKLKSLLQLDKIPRKYHNTNVLKDGLYLVQILKACQELEAILGQDDVHKNFAVKRERLKKCNFDQGAWDEFYDSMKRESTHTNEQDAIMALYYIKCQKIFVKRYKQLVMLKEAIMQADKNVSDDEQKVDGDAVQANDQQATDLSVIATPSSHISTEISLNSPSLEIMKNELTARFPLIAPEKVELMVAEKVMEYKMQQKLEKERQHFEAAKTKYTEQKANERHEENKKNKLEADEKVFKQKEQEIKLNERQHKEQLEQRKQIANNEARMKQREFDEKESEKHEKMKHDYMSMSFAIGIWIFCILLSIRFKNKLLEKFSVKQHPGSMLEGIIYDVLPFWFSTEYIKVGCCFLGSFVLLYYVHVVAAMLPPIYLMYIWFGNELLGIAARGRGYALWYTMLVTICYQVIPYIFFTPRGWDVALLGIDILPVLITVVFPLVFVYLAFVFSLNIVCATEDFECKETIFSNVWNLVQLIFGDIF